MKVLITGGVGYVGGRVAKHLREHTNHALALSKTPSRSIPAWASEYEIHDLDMTKPKTMVEAVKGVDAVIHLAALNEQEAAASPEKAMQVNVEGTRHLLEAASKAGVRFFLYLSTFHVYDKQHAHITEKTPRTAQHPYSMTKRLAEDLVHDFVKNEKLQSCCIRLSNGYGYPASEDMSRWNLVVNDFCRQAVEKQKIVIKSSGNQFRNFVSLENVARAIVHALHLRVDKLGDGIFNLGGELFTIYGMAEKVAGLCQEKWGFTPVIERQTRKGEQPQTRFHYDMEKFLNTGFEPIDNTGEEIVRTLDLCHAHFHTT